MLEPANLPWNAPLASFESQAQGLSNALKAGDHDAAWRFKWELPRFRGAVLGTVLEAIPSLSLSDAQVVLAHDYGFNTWEDLVAFTRAAKDDPATIRFETAVDAVVSGDIATLSALLAEDPSLVEAHSARRHKATLLHYVAANGVEGIRQKTPANAVAVMKLLLDAGAEPDALGGMYGHACTTMSMLVSSSHPAEAGVQAALAGTLVDYGAEIDEGPGTEWQSAVLTALKFGYLDTARALVERGANVNTLHMAAGLGRLEDVRRLLPDASAESRHSALALAAQLGHVDVVRVLLDADEDPNRYNPEGHHSHATPLHQAIWADHMDVVRLLVERGARLDIKDSIFEGTALGWAEYGGKSAIAEYLRGAGAPS